jgi:hypothetical protein
MELLDYIYTEMSLKVIILSTCNDDNDTRLHDTSFRQYDPNLFPMSDRKYDGMISLNWHYTTSDREESKQIPKQSGAKHHNTNTMPLLL